MPPPIDKATGVCDGRCPFCEILATARLNRQIEDTLLAQTSNFEWIPGMGAFIEGYSIVISKAHLLTTGDLELSRIVELERFIREIKELLSVLYGKKSIVFEHGEMGSGCIEHHHLHILPIELRTVPSSLSRQFSYTVISSIMDLCQRRQDNLSYIYLELSNGKQVVFETPQLSRQFMRKVMASEYGCHQDWDWRENPFLDNIHRFVHKVEELRNQEGECQNALLNILR